MFNRVISTLLCVTFSFSNLQYSQAQDFSVNQLPVPGTMVGESAPFAPLALKGIVVNPQKLLEFKFIVDTGHGPQDTATIKDQANQLVKYFLAGLTIPEGDLWVNLSPYEKNRMVPEALGQTDLGRDLLAQDYILKQLTASLIYPEKDLGKEFWSRVYAKAQAQFGTTNIPVNTFNKVWILPDQAQVFENVNAAYVTKSTLKVMLDEDYLALYKHKAPRNGTDSIGSQIVRAIILPEIEKEVNTGKNFAPLRQIYQALILAKWYKGTIQNGVLDAIYTNKNKVAGVNLNDPAVKEQIYERYLKAYKKGAFNYIKEDPTPDGQVVPRKYFSGGTSMAMIVDTHGNEQDVENQRPSGTLAVLTEDLEESGLPKDATMTNMIEDNFREDIHAWGLENRRYYKINGQLMTYMDFRELADAMEDSGVIFDGDYKPYSGADSYIVGIAHPGEGGKSVDVSKEAALHRQGIKISRTIEGGKVHYYSMPKSEFLELWDYLRMMKFEDSQLAFEYLYKQAFPDIQAHEKMKVRQIEKAAAEIKQYGLTSEDARSIADNLDNGRSVQTLKQQSFIAELQKRGYKFWPYDLHRDEQNKAKVRAAAQFLLKVADEMDKSEAMTSLLKKPLVQKGIAAVAVLGILLGIYFYNNPSLPADFNVSNVNKAFPADKIEIQSVRFKSTQGANLKGARFILKTSYQDLEDQYLAGNLIAAQLLEGVAYSSSGEDMVGLVAKAKATLEKKVVLKPVETAENIDLERSLTEPKIEGKSLSSLEITGKPVTLIPKAMESMLKKLADISDYIIVHTPDEPNSEGEFWVEAFAKPEMREKWQGVEQIRNSRFFNEIIGLGLPIYKNPIQPLGDKDTGTLIGFSFQLEASKAMMTKWDKEETLDISKLLKMDFLVDRLPIMNAVIMGLGIKSKEEFAATFGSWLVRVTWKDGEEQDIASSDIESRMVDLENRPISAIGTEGKLEFFGNFKPGTSRPHPSSEVKPKVRSAKQKKKPGSAAMLTELKMGEDLKLGPGETAELWVKKDGRNFIFQVIRFGEGQNLRAVLKNTGGEVGDATVGIPYDGGNFYIEIDPINNKVIVVSMATQTDEVRYEVSPAMLTGSNDWLAPEFQVPEGLFKGLPDAEKYFKDRPLAAGVRILFRVNLNVSIEDGQVSKDDTARLMEAVPLLNLLLAQGADVILIGHNGRAKPKDNRKSVEATEKFFQAQFPDTSVKFYPKYFNGDGSPLLTPSALVKDPTKQGLGSISIGENIRLSDEEEPVGSEKRKAFGQLLTSLADAYVVDAFADIDSKGVSMEDLPGLFVQAGKKVFVGPSMVKESERLIAAQQKGVKVIISGAEKEEKLGPVQDILKNGKLAQGGFILLGSSPSLRLQKETDHPLMHKENKDKVFTALDYVGTGDIDPQTITLYSQKLDTVNSGDTVLVQGILGWAENKDHPEYENGTRAIW